MDRSVLRAQNISRMCLVCGKDNRFGLHARFLEIEGGEIVGLFTPAEEHQGYPGRLHGGMSSAILDETMGRAINITDPDAWGVTVELNVRFRKAVPLFAETRVVGRITRDTSRLFEASGEILLDDGTVAVSATGTYMRLPIDRIAEGDFDGEWFDDDREHPGTIEA
jgi:acyl-coenzyme A thioesterase PaaI-like protein